MLYAGTASLLSFKYYNSLQIFRNSVKMLKQRSKSAGNIYYSNGTSETTRNEIVTNSEHIKLISNHVPKHLKSINDDQLGHYLAGLIDGDGYFSKIPQLVIVFSYSDAYLAYFLKEKLGFGSVKKVKNKNAFLFVISNKDGIIRILNLINGKLRTEHRFNQVVNNVLANDKYKLLNIKFTINLSNDFANHWLAGFTDADGSFQIKIINRSTRNKPEIRLNYQIDQKSDQLLIKIKEYLGGNIGYRKSQDTYYYGSTSFGSAKKVIEYFDIFHLQSRKHISYLRWRKVYRLIQNKEHITADGLTKIIKIKALMNKHELATTI